MPPRINTASTDAGKRLLGGVAGREGRRPCKPDAKVPHPVRHAACPGGLPALLAALPDLEVIGEESEGRVHDLDRRVVHRDLDIARRSGDRPVPTSN